MNAKQLRNSILQMAIDGKLVPQDPNDEPASVLLDKIREEKKRLVKEGVLKKKDLEETPISEDEKPFEIPENWVWCRWGNLSESIQYGYNAPALSNGDIRMVRISDIQDGNVLWETVPFCNIKTEDINTYLLKPNDILFARTGGTVGKSFLVKETPYPSIYAGYLIRTRYSTKLCPQFMKFFMESQLYWDQLRNGTIATAQPNCNGKTLSKMCLPLPPLSEQHRIVEKLEELLPIVDEYGKAQEEADELQTEMPDKLRKSILQQAIKGKLVPQDPNDEPASVLLNRIREEKKRLVKEGVLKKKDLEETPISEDEKPFDIPDNWVWCRVQTVCNFAQPKKQKGSKILLDARYLRGKSSGESVNEGRFVQKGAKIILVDGENSGEVFEVPIEGYMGSTFKELMINKEIDLRYFNYFMLLMKDKLRDNKRGAAIPHLDKVLFFDSSLPLPPLAEQHRIVAKIEEIFNYIDNKAFTD